MTSQLQPASYGSLAAALDPCIIFEKAFGPPDTWQREALRENNDRMMFCCSRQAGKSCVLGTKAAARAAFHPGSLVLEVAPVLRQASELFVKTRLAYRALGEPSPVKNESALKLELENGSRVICIPADEETTRGYSVNLLLLDESARIPDSVFYGLMPMASVTGGTVIAASTPRGQQGWFHHNWTSDPGWRKFRVPASEVPRLTEEELARQREQLGELFFAQEFLCQFIAGDIAGFIKPEHVDQCAGLQPPVEAFKNAPLHIGLDCARSAAGDWTVFVLAKCDTVVEIERLRTADTMAVCGRAVQLIEQHRAKELRLDAGSFGAAIYDRLREMRSESLRGSPLWGCSLVPVHFGGEALDKKRYANWAAEVFFDIARRLERGELRLPAPSHPLYAVLAEQLTSRVVQQDSRGRARLQSKSELRGSPDVLDALMLAVFDRSRLPGAVRIRLIET